MRLELSHADLKPIVEAVVVEVLDRVEEDRAKLNGKLGYSEPEAAALVSVKPHVLRDCRLRGEIQAKKVGKSYRYSRSQLLRFLESEADA